MFLFAPCRRQGSLVSLYIFFLLPSILLFPVVRFKFTHYTGLSDLFVPMGHLKRMVILYLIILVTGRKPPDSCQRKYPYFNNSEIFISDIHKCQNFKFLNIFKFIKKARSSQAPEMWSKQVK